MNVGVEIPRTPCSAASQSLKRSSPQNDRRAPKPPKRRKQNVKRNLSKVFEEDAGEDEFSCRLSAQTRDTVLKLRKINDPFDADLQQVVDDVFQHIDQQPEEEVDLAESALLLSSVTQVYSTQVKTLHEEVLEIAARLTGKESPRKSRGRKKKEDEQKVEGEATAEEKSSQDQNGDPTANGGDNNNNVNCDGDAAATTEKKDGESGEGVSVALPTDGNSEGAAAGEANPASGKNPDANEVKDKDVDENGEAKPGTTPEQLETEILNEIPSRCTRRQSERLKNILSVEKEKERDYSLKKKKYDDDPPDLISCHEEWNTIMELISSKGDIDFDEILPPVLEVQVGRRKKVTINNNEIDDDTNCEACQSAEGPVQKEENEKQDQDPLKALISSGSDSQQYETLDHLSDDVQERFHALIQEMHKLPFDYDLMQQDMFKAYQQKFLQAVTLLSQNSVLVKRSETEAEEPKETKVVDVEVKDPQLSETDKTISTIAELLNQVRFQAAEDYNKGKQSKSDAEVPISQMIATLKRIICSRYKKWHVRTDGDKAVFKRIREFEDKVKAVLKREAEQGLFDVKKYEMEVMDVTLKESQDGDGDEYFSPTSPIPYQDGAVSPRPEDNKLFNLNSISRRTSVAGSVDGSSSWIRLVDIFSHMKKIDNSETCRHFYAVLALLSHKNLSINYDTLFSKESAKLITKLLKSQKEGEGASKYPVGAKIMTSRCPDIDRDELFLAAVFNPDTLQQALEQDYLSSSGYQSDSQASSSTSFSPAPGPIPTKSIQDAINEFVVDPGEPFAMEDLFSKRRRKQ